MIKNIFLVLTFITITFPLNAQESIHKNPFWLSVSVGGSSKYLNVSASYNKSLKIFSYQISINGITESIFSKYGMTTGNLGIGFAHCEDWLISSVHLGPSVSYGEALTKADEPAYFWGAGLAVNAQSYFMPFHKMIPGVGLGVELFYNLNVYQTKDVNFRSLYSIRIGFCLTNIHM